MIFFDCCLSWRLTSWTQDLLCHGGVQFLMGKKIPDFLPPKFRPPYRALFGEPGFARRALFGEPGFARYGDRNSGWQKIWYYFQDLWSSAFLCVSPASALRAVQATKNACLNPPNLYFFDSQISFLETVQKKNFAAAGNSPLGRPCGAQNLRRKVSTVSFSKDLSVPQFSHKKNFFF